MVTFCLIGGKINKDIMTNKIESHLISLTKKECPNILFFPFAATDYKKANLRFKNLMNNLSANIYYMEESDLSNFDNLLNKADILYISGGISDDLIKLFKDLKLDEILIKYLNTDKIYAGISAGAMLFTKSSMGDKYMYSDNFHNYNYKMVDGLGILNLGICPHYQNEDLIFYNDVIKQYDFDAFGLEEDSAIIIEDNHFYCIKEESNVAAYYFKGNDFVMTDLKEGVIYEKIGGFRTKGNI